MIQSVRECAWLAFYSRKQHPFDAGHALDETR
jgi:hypothetical protein